jgi:hypothetical protein
VHILGKVLGSKGVDKCGAYIGLMLWAYMGIF